jgi:hypothetical protein
MTRVFTAYAAGFAMTVALAASADPATDLLGAWSGEYTAVSPTNSSGAGPRFSNAEIVLEIKEQQGSVFWGEGRWRRQGSEDWAQYEITGNLSADDSGKIGMVESSSDPSFGVNALIDAQLDDEKLYVSVRSLARGTTYSAVLERSDVSN